MTDESMLITWAEIAGFFKITTKTAKKWHKEFGMPIVRQPGNGIPMQYPSVLWTWVCAHDEARKKRGL